MPPSPSSLRLQRRFMGVMGVLDAALGAVAFGMGHQQVGWFCLVASAATFLLSMFWGSKSSTTRTAVPTSQDVSTPTLSRLKPIMKLREEITGLLEKNDDNPVVAVLGSDMQAEVDALAVRSVEILDARRKVVDLSSGVYKNKAAVQRLEQERATATDTNVIESLKKAIEARGEEMTVYTELETLKDRLDAELTEAESTLAELRSQILRAAADSARDNATEELDPFDSLTDRMRRLSKTMEESIETVRTGTWA